MNNRRRIFLKGSMAASLLGVAAGAGLLLPKGAIAAWSEAAFGADNAIDGVKAITGIDSGVADLNKLPDSADIKIKAPDIAENGAVVPVTISSTLANIESISIVAENNPTPLVASFNPGDGAEGFVATRIKMGKSGNVIAIVKADGKLFKSAKEVKVTIGGCGG